MAEPEQSSGVRRLAVSGASGKTGWRVVQEDLRQGLAQGFLHHPPAGLAAGAAHRQPPHAAGLFRLRHPPLVSRSARRRP